MELSLWAISEQTDPQLGLALWPHFMDLGDGEKVTRVIEHVECKWQWEVQIPIGVYGPSHCHPGDHHRGQLQIKLSPDKINTHGHPMPGYV